MREVRIRDTLSGELRSLDAGEEIGIYACGPTVYSRIHIGNARPFVVFTLLARFLRSEGYRARLVVNATDVNDKIYEAARAVGEPSAAFAARMTRAYFEDTEGKRPPVTIGMAMEARRSETNETVLGRFVVSGKILKATDFIEMREGKRFAAEWDVVRSRIVSAAMVWP